MHATTPTGVRVDPDIVYREHDLLADGLFSFNELAKGRAAGRLRFHEPIRGTRIYLGRWLLDWLTGAAPTTGGAA